MDKLIKFTTIVVLATTAGFLAIKSLRSNNLESASDNPPSYSQNIKSSINIIDKLIDAAVDGDVDKLRNLLMDNPDVDVNTRDSKGNIALIEACYYANPKIVDILIDDYNADINIVDKEGNTALLKACRSGREAGMTIVSKLLAKGADIHKTDSDGNTPLIVACQVYGRDVLEYIVAPNNTSMPEGNLEIVNLLIQNGSDVNAVALNGDTPLLKACGSRNIYTIRLLLEAGAKLNAKNHNGETALMLASNNNIENVRLLLDKGSDVNAVDKNGKTAFEHAGGPDMDEIRKLLTSHKSKNKQKTGVTHVVQPSPEMLIKAVRAGTKEEVSKLLDKGANANARNNELKTALMFACIRGNKDIVKTLLDHGASLFPLDKSAKDAFDYAAEKDEIISTLNEHLDSIKGSAMIGMSREMLAAEAELYIPPAPMQLTKAVVAGNYLEVMDFLSRKAYINETDENGRTPLMAACLTGNTKIAMVLIDSKANTTLKDKNGNTALDLVKEQITKVESEVAVGNSNYKKEDLVNLNEIVRILSTTTN